MGTGIIFQELKIAFTTFGMETRVKNSVTVMGCSTKILPIYLLSGNSGGFSCPGHCALSIDRRQEICNCGTEGETNYNNNNKQLKI